MEKGFEKATASGICGSKTGLNTIAERHQCIYLGDDAVLLSERWKRNVHCQPGGVVYGLVNGSLTESRNRRTLQPWS